MSAPAPRRTRRQYLPDANGYQRCTKCLIPKPHTREYFAIVRGGGVGPVCKVCRNIQQKEQRMRDKLRGPKVDYTPCAEPTGLAPYQGPPIPMTAWEAEILGIDTGSRRNLRNTSDILLTPYAVSAGAGMD